MDYRVDSLTGTRIVKSFSPYHGGVVVKKRVSEKDRNPWVRFLNHGSGLGLVFRYVTKEIIGSLHEVSLKHKTKVLISGQYIEWHPNKRQRNTNLNQDVKIVPLVSSLQLKDWVSWHVKVWVSQELVTFYSQPQILGYREGWVNLPIETPHKMWLRVSRGHPNSTGVVFDQNIVANNWRKRG